MARRLGNRKATISVNGERLVELRVDANLSQEEFALRADVSKGYVSQIETGKSGKISEAAFNRIVGVFGVEREELLSQNPAARALQTKVLKFSGIEEDRADRDQVMAELKATMTYANRLVKMLETK